MYFSKLVGGHVLFVEKVEDVAPVSPPESVPDCRLTDGHCYYLCMQCRSYSCCERSVFFVVLIPNI